MPIGWTKSSSNYFPCLSLAAPGSQQVPECAPNGMVQKTIGHPAQVSLGFYLWEMLIDFSKYVFGQFYGWKTLDALAWESLSKQGCSI